MAEIDRLRFDREAILSRYDSGALPPGVALTIKNIDARVKKLESDEAWANHNHTQEET